MTNTTSFDIPGQIVTQNLGYYPVSAKGDTLYGPPTGIGYITHMISSPRQIQMSLAVNFGEILLSTSQGWDV